MVLKKLFNLMRSYLPLILLAAYFVSTLTAADNNEAESQSIQLSSSSEFTLVSQDVSTFNIRPLKPQLRSIENLRDTEAVGITYLGNITLAENATPLSALRDLSVQISSGLGIDLALITDSTTSQSLQPHEMLLLYHPQLVITLALTKVPDSDEYTLIGTYAILVTATQSASDDSTQSPESPKE